MKEKNVILFTGGSGPKKKYITSILKNAYFTVAADSGLDLALKYGIKPDLVVGDMDSVKHKKYIEKLPEGEKIVYPRDKDETDTEIGMRVLYGKGFRKITVIGGGGGRIDHFLAILYLFFREIRPEKWYTNDYFLACIDRAVLIYGKPGGTLSFFPASKESCTMRSHGLQWNLDGLIWNVGDAGISNILTESPCRVEPAQGRLMLVARLREELTIE